MLAQAPHVKVLLISWRNAIAVETFAQQNPDAFPPAAGTLPCRLDKLPYLPLAHFMLLFITHLLIIISNIFVKTCQDSGGAINPVNAAIMRQE